MSKCLGESDKWYTDNVLSGPPGNFYCVPFGSYLVIFQNFTANCSGCLRAHNTSIKC